MIDDMIIIISSSSSSTTTTSSSSSSSSLHHHHIIINNIMTIRPQYSQKQSKTTIFGQDDILSTPPPGHPPPPGIISTPLNRVKRFFDLSQPVSPQCSLGGQKNVKRPLGLIRNLILKFDLFFSYVRGGQHPFLTIFHLSKSSQKRGGSAP
jgi:hypothetical protein